MRNIPFLALLLASSSLVHHVQYTVDALPPNLGYWKELMPAHQDINLDDRPTVRIIKRNSLPVLKRRSLRERAPPANDPKGEDKAPEDKTPDGKAPENKDKPTENKDKPTENKDKPTENKDKAPENKDKAPENKDKAPENKDKAPENKGDNKHNDGPHKDQKEGNASKGNTPTNASSPSESVTVASSNSGAATAVQTGNLSSPAIVGLSVVGGIFALVGAFFAFMRRKKHQEQTSAIVAKSATAFEQQSSAYEKMDDSTQSLGTYIVVDTHLPLLDDELELQPGEKVTVLVEYDDGWVQGINESRDGIKGVFPRHCVDMGNNGFDNKIDKRTSSIHGGYQSINLH